MNHPTDDHGLLQEIEEDLQRQRFAALWKRFGPYVVGGALGIVLATGLVTGVQAYKTKGEETRTANLVAALEKKESDPKAGLQALEELAEKNQGTTQALMARLQAAAALAQQGRTEEAMKIYESLADDQSAGQIFRDLAALSAAQTGLDTGDPAALEKKLEALRKEDNAFRFSAEEYAGNLALREGDREKAKAVFQRLLAMKNVPETIAMRARDMLNWLNGGS